MGDYFNEYIEGKLTLLEAYAMCESKYFKLIHSGIYGGKVYDSILIDRNRLAQQIARASLIADGYMVDTLYGYREWKKLDAMIGSI